METFMADEGMAVDTQPEVQQTEQVIDDGMQEEGQEAAQEVKEEKPQEDHIPKGVQKRIDRAVRQKYEAEARARVLEERLAALERQAPASKPQNVDAPRLEQFDNIEDYVTAKAEWVAEQQINKTFSARERAEAEAKANQQRKSVGETWAKKVAQATAEMPDFEDVVASSDIQFNDPIALQAIQESDVGPQIAYYLASNPDEADAIAQLTGTAAIRAIGRIEAKIQDKKVAVTKTPEPIKPVGQRAKVDKDPTQMTDKEFAAWRKKYTAAR